MAEKSFKEKNPPKIWVRACEYNRLVNQDKQIQRAFGILRRHTKISVAGDTAIMILDSNKLATEELAKILDGEGIMMDPEITNVEIKMMDDKWNEFMDEIKKLSPEELEALIQKIKQEQEEGKE